MNGTSCRVCPGATAATAVSMLDTMPSSAVCSGPGRFDRCRVATPVNNPMTAISTQVVTTVLVTSSGPARNTTAASMSSPLIGRHSRISR